MKVGAPPCDPLMVYNYRTLWPVQECVRQGLVDVFDPLDEGVRLRKAMREHGPDEILGLAHVPEVDVVVLTRVLAGRLVEAVRYFKQAGIAVVVDIDDDFRHTAPLLGGREKIDPLRSPEYNWRHLAQACAVADHVTVSTPALRRYAPHGRVSVIRNRVPIRYTTTQRAPSQGTAIVGWSGTVASHAGDLDITHGGVAEAVSMSRSKFMVVGDPEGVQQRLGLADDPMTTGLVESYVYPTSISRFTVGIAPLADTAYNRAKSWLKPLEYTALGVPWVGSPTPEYELFMRALEDAGYGGMGDLVRGRGRNWRSGVLQALKEAQTRQEIIRDGVRDWIAQEMSITAHAHEWVDAWERAVDHRKANR